MSIAKKIQARKSFTRGFRHVEIFAGKYHAGIRCHGNMSAGKRPRGNVVESFCPLFIICQIRISLLTVIYVSVISRIYL